MRQLSLPECVTHFLLRFWPSAQFAIAPKPFKMEVSGLACLSLKLLLKLQQVGEQQRYGGSLAVEQCNNYTWVLKAVAEGGKSRDVQGEKIVACLDLLFTAQAKLTFPALVSLCSSHRGILSSVLSSCCKRWPIEFCSLESSSTNPTNIQY